MRRIQYLRLKACPRCGGDIIVDNLDESGEVCLQCGYRKTVPAPPVEEREPEGKYGKQGRGRPRGTKNR